jgi:hypothetical protein
MKVTPFNEGHGFTGCGMSLYRQGKSLYEGHGFSRAENALITRRL